MSDRFVIWFSTSAGITWLIKHFASRVDPLIFKATNGRFTSMGVPSMPMLTLTAVGRHSGQQRSVHLACIEHRGDHLVVASAMGQEKHPAWRYNIDANPRVEVQIRGEAFAANGRVLSDAEKSDIWPEIHRAIPQMKVYEKRTQRNIRVYRLSRVAA